MLVVFPKIPIPLEWPTIFALLLMIDDWEVDAAAFPMKIVWGGRGGIHPTDVDEKLFVLDRIGGDNNWRAKSSWKA